MKSKVGAFFDNGAIGDQCFSLCKAYSACRKFGVKSIDVHTDRVFFYHHGPEDRHIVTPNSNVFSIWAASSLVNSIHFSFSRHTWQEDHKRLSGEYEFFFIDLPHQYSVQDINMKDWLDMRMYRTLDLEGEKIAIFQPTSLKLKPKATRQQYIMIWDQSLKALMDLGYEIYMIGSNEDRQVAHQTIHPDRLGKIHDLMGKVSILSAIEMVMYQSDFVLSCDSWAGLYGVANKVKTCLALGPKTWDGDIEYFHFLGNRSYWCAAASAKPKEADQIFAHYINHELRKA